MMTTNPLFTGFSSSQTVNKEMTEVLRSKIEVHIRMTQITLSPSDAFVINKALRYDVKGKKYIETPHRYYFTDIGLRNARMNFRQQEVNSLNRIKDS